MLIEGFGVPQFLNAFLKAFSEIIQPDAHLCPPPPN